MAVIEDADSIDLRVYVEGKTLVSEGLSEALLAAMMRSGAVRGLYSGFRLFVVREQAREWLAAHAPEAPLPRSLDRRKRVLTRVFARKVGWSAPEPTSATTVSTVPTLPMAYASRTSVPVSSSPELEAPMATSSASARPAPTPSQPKAVTTATPKAMTSEKEVRGGLKSKGKGASKPKTRGRPRTKAPIKARRPSDAKIRALHGRLLEAKSAEDRKTVYEESGFHPVALSRWFRMLELEKIGPVIAKPKAKSNAKRGRGRPRKEEKAKTTAVEAPKAPSPRAVKGTVPGLTLVPGLSLKSRETAIELLRALLTE